MGKRTGRRLIGDLDPEGLAQIGTAVTGSRVFGHVKLSASPLVGGHEAQDHVEAAQAALAPTFNPTSVNSPRIAAFV
jgi:hypothetical protein